MEVLIGKVLMKERPDLIICISIVLVMKRCVATSGNKKIKKINKQVKLWASKMEINKQMVGIIVVASTAFSFILGRIWHAE